MENNIDININNCKFVDGGSFYLNKREVVKGWF